MPSLDQITKFLHKKKLFLNMHLIISDLIRWLRYDVRIPKQF